MKRVQARFLRAEITAYLPKENEVTIQLLADDSTLRKFTHTIAIRDPARQAGELLKNARTQLRKEHEKSLDSAHDDPLGRAVHVAWMQDEDMLHEKLARFLSEVRERMRSAMRKQASYYDVRQQLTGLNCKL